MADRSVCADRVFWHQRKDVLEGQQEHGLDGDLLPTMNFFDLQIPSERVESYDVISKSACPPGNLKF